MWTHNQSSQPATHSAATRRNMALGFLFLYWVLFNYLVFQSPITWFHSPAVESIDQVLFQSNSSQSPDALDPDGWQPDTLPDNWYHSRRNAEQGWYRASFDVQTLDDDVWAVYLPQVTHNAAVFVNDIWVGQGGDMPGVDNAGKLARNHNTPLFFSFSSSLLKPGSNRIDIHVATTHPHQGLFDAFYVAPAVSLQNAYQWKYFVRVTTMQWLTITMIMMGIIIFAFWLARPQDAIYGLFSLELFFWSAHNLNLTVVDIPVATTLWEAMIMSTLGWTVITMILFNHRFLNEKHPAIEKSMMIFAVSGIGIFFLPDLGSILTIGYGIWDSFLLLFGSYTIYFLVRAYLRTKDTDIFLMLLVGIPILVFGFHDILVVNHHWNRLDGLIIQYSVIPAVVLFGWFLLRRFVQSIDRAEHLAETLEIRVRQKQQALQQQYDQVSELEKQQVLAEERNRIMRDMHDGIGGQLVTIIAMLRDQDSDIIRRTRERVQHSLTDLRFVIDSLDPMLNDLPTLLGTMRQRMREQLESADIELEWAVTELPPVNAMTPQHNLHIMRIVQEAFTNSIKHSDTSSMKLSTGVITENDEDDNARTRIYIDIIDYGKGFSATETSDDYGRGIDNMRYRAQQVHGELDIQSTDKGTHVRLLLTGEEPLAYDPS